MIRIGEQEIEDLLWGAAVLGAGGGGDPYLGLLMAKKAIGKYGPISLIHPLEVPDDALVISTAIIGADTILLEKIPRGNEAYASVKKLEEYLGKKAYGVMTTECGGFNSTVPFVVAAQAGLPVIDADAMGRAFPEQQMTSFHIYGLKGSPMVMTNEKSDCCVLETKDNYFLEKLCRSISVEYGGVAYFAGYSLTGKELKEASIPNTLSFSLRLGRAIREARENKQDVIEAIIETTSNSVYGRAIKLFSGKITDIKRNVVNGFMQGKTRVQGFQSFSGQTLEVCFQNENLIAYIDGKVVATVPDIVMFFDEVTGIPLPTTKLRYGYRVVVLGIPTPEIMRTEAALNIWGPKCFGYELDYVPLEILHSAYYNTAPEFAS